MVYPTNAFDSRLQGDQVPLGSSPTKSQKKKKKRYRTCCSLRTSLQLQLHHDQHQGLRCVRCYARRLGDSRRNAHAKAQAALEPGLRQTSHAIVWPLRPPFLSFSLPPRQTQKVAADADARTAIECEMSVLAIDCSPNQYYTNCEAKQFNLSDTLKVNLMCM